MSLVRVLLNIHVVAPQGAGDDTISVRVDSLIRLDLTISTSPPGTSLPWEFINIPNTASVKNRAFPAPQRYSNFSLELRGAMSNSVCRVACDQCGRRKSQRGIEIVDFSSPTDFVEIVDGRARICFRLKCYAQHNLQGDDAYMYAPKRFRP